MNESYLALTNYLFRSAGYTTSGKAQPIDLFLSVWPTNLRHAYFFILGFVGVYQLNQRFDPQIVLEKILRFNFGSVFAICFLLIVILANSTLILSILRHEWMYITNIASGLIGLFTTILGAFTLNQNLLFKTPTMLWAFIFLVGAMFANHKYRMGMFPLSTSRRMRSKYFPPRSAGRYRILIIQPTLKNDGVADTALRSRYPFTIPYLAALLPNHWDPMLVHTVFDEIDYDIDTDIVAITAMALNFKYATEIAEGFRKKGKTVIFGGADPSRQAEKYLQFGDSVLIGAAEDYLPKMLEDWERGQLKRKYVNPVIPDLKNMALPRYDLLPLRRYSNSHNILVSTSCPYKCSFCQYNRTREPRLRPVEDVLRAIRATPSKFFWFEAPELLVYKKYVRELEGVLRGKGIHWASHATMRSCGDETTLKLAFSAGLRSILIGLESFNDATLALLNKKTNVVADYQKIFSLLDKCGISVSVHMIFGTITDRSRDFVDALDGVIKGKVSLVHVHNMTCFAGDEEFEKVVIAGGGVEYDCLKKFKMKERFGLAIYRSSKFSDAEMVKFYNDFHNKFYSLPSIFKRIFLRSLKNFCNFVPDFQENISYHLFRRSHGGYSADLYQTFAEFIDEPVEEVAQSLDSVALEADEPALVESKIARSS